MRNEFPLSAKSFGFTFIELMVSLSIGVIVATLTTPMANMLRNSTVSSLSYEFVAALNLARSEAIKRGNKVTVCRTIDGTKCEGKPDVNDQKDWSEGWIVFSDLNGDGKVNPSQDQILLVHSPLPHGYTLRSNARVRVTYKPIGISPGYMDSWTLCTPGKNPALTKGIVIAYTGRVRLAKDSNHNGIIDNGTAAMQGEPTELLCEPV